MHELSIAQSIVEAVEARAAECNATHVRQVRLKIGDASGIVIDSLAFCFEMLVGLDPVLAGAQLSIDRVPHRARCRHCAQEFDVQNFVAQCPTCQEWSNEVISGTELQIIEMEIESGSPSLLEKWREWREWRGWVAGELAPPSGRPPEKWQ